MTDPSPDPSIINAVLEGDTEAYAELIRLYQARIRLLCLTYLANVEEADDAAQEIFLKAFKALNTFKGEASFQTWIYRIAHNHCRDLWRARRRHKTESLDALMEEKGEAFYALLASNPSDEKIYTMADWSLLSNLFAALSEEDREILVLREIEELSYEAMAARLGCTLDAVKGRLKRARQRLEEKCRAFS